MPKKTPASSVATVAVPHHCARTDNAQTPAYRCRVTYDETGLAGEVAVVLNGATMGTYRWWVADGENVQVA